MLLCSSIFHSGYSSIDTFQSSSPGDNSDYSEAMRLLKQVEKIKNSKAKPREPIQLEGINRDSSSYMQIPLSASFILLKYPLTILICTILTYILLSRCLPKSFS